MLETCPNAVVGRYGGEEFALIFDCALPAAIEAVDRARASVAGKRYRLRDADTVLGTITFSAGVVAACADDTFESAFDRADSLLYAAKAEGRNRVAH